MSKSKALAVTPKSPAPNDRDLAAIKKARSRFEQRGKRASVKVSGTAAATSVQSPHSDRSGHCMQMLDAFGTPSGDFMNGTFSQLVNALRDRGSEPTSEVSTNAAVTLMAGLEPTNELEALIASQMAATHSLAMIMLGRTRRVELLSQIEAQGGLAVKLLRTFTMQAEALAKLRRGGGQTVRVEHVHVHPGGQAIVGNVATGGGADLKTEDQPHAKPVAALAHAEATFDPLRSKDAARDAVPVARHA